jgi:hypothetical protein
MQTGATHGMQTMDSALAELVRNRKITRELAMARAGHPDELGRLLGGVAPSGNGNAMGGGAARPNGSTAVVR